MALLPGLARLGTDNAPAVYFLRGSPAVARFHAFEEELGGEPTLRIAVSGPGLWTREGLVWLAGVEQRAAKVPGVGQVGGLWTHHHRAGLDWPPGDPVAFRRAVTVNEVDRNAGWIGESGRTATVSLTLGAGSAADRQALAALRALVARPPAGVRASLAGLPALESALDAASRQVGGRFFPLLVLLAIVLLAVSFRSASGVALPLLFVGAAEISLLGAMGYAGVELNLVVAILPPLVFAVALATAVHLLSAERSFERPGHTRREATLSTYRDKGWAVFWTGITTIVGFASLAVSPLGPVRTLGLWSAVGIALMTIGAFSFYPALLARPGGSLRARPASPYERKMRGIGRRWAEGAVRRRRLVLGVAIGLAAAAALGLPRLRVETNALHYLPAAAPARAAIEELEAEGIGVGAVEVVLRRPGCAAPGWRSPSGLERLDRVARALRREPGVLGALGAADVVDDLARRSGPGALFGARSARGAVLDRLEHERSGAAPGPLAPFFGTDGCATRLTVLTPVVGVTTLRPLLGRLEATTAVAAPGAEIETTGQYPLVVAAQARLLSTLGASLAITLFVIALIFWVLLRDLRLALLALVPNVWPILLMLGVMGWSGLPLDIATVMVASIALGLAVDDTIHTLGHFRELAPRLGAREAIAGTLERTAPAYLLTGLILAAGFGVSALSSFAPLERFGICSALALSLAVGADLVLVPALLGVGSGAESAEAAHRRLAG